MSLVLVGVFSANFREAYLLGPLVIRGAGGPKGEPASTRKKQLT
jgi:hypothetical protein